MLTTGSCSEAREAELKMCGRAEAEPGNRLRAVLYRTSAHYCCDAQEEALPAMLWKLWSSQKPLRTAEQRAWRSQILRWSCLQRFWKKEELNLALGRSKPSQ